MTIQLSPLSHICAVVGDASEAVRFLRAVFAAPTLKRSSSSFAEEEARRILYAGLGDVTLGFLEPGPTKGHFRSLLEEQGPLVHSLAFFVDDIDTAIAVLAGEGVRLVSRSLTPVIGGAGVAPAPTVLADTMSRLGFNLELFQGSAGRTNIGGISDRSRGGLCGNLSPLLHVELAVDDLDDPYGLLHRLFGSEKIETRLRTFSARWGRSISFT